MSSAHALWWLALPVLMLPIWWHRQKRQRTQAVPLATARFLPAAAPQQLRVWRWTDRALLLLRLLLLLGLIAWLADLAVPWRGDTAFVGGQVDPAWADVQIQSADLGAARRRPLPAADPLAWLAAHEREWRTDARLAIIATGDAVPMPVNPPALAHRVELRLQPSTSASAPFSRHVVLASTRAVAWRALFSAFESAGLGRERYQLQTEPDAQTELIVWDRPGTPDPAWRAPLWWAVQPAAFPELSTARRSKGLRVADVARGRVWAQDRWPLDEADPLAAARELFENRDGLRRDPLPFAAPTMTLAAGAAPSADAVAEVGRPLLAPLLALLFALERALAHRASSRMRAVAATGGAEPTPAAR
jgi:hypothetical protein